MATFIVGFALVGVLGTLALNSLGFFGVNISRKREEDSNHGS